VEWFDHTSRNSLGTDLTVFILLGIIPCGGGVLLLRRTVRNARRRRHEGLEGAILRLASGMKNKLTAAEVAAHMNLPITDARRLLDRFCEKGIARLEISDSGVKVYWFWELVSDEEKNSAELI
jgi:hypothetical protein